MRDDSGLGQVDLPSGGGGIAPLGDRFQPDLVRGSGSYAIPLPVPRGPNDLAPAPTLRYSTGSGNGPFGLGWRLDATRVERRTDRGQPRYTDEDEFTLGGAEVLVPVGGGRYRPRTDTQSWHVERLPGADPARGWRIRDGRGRTQLLGATEDGRETGPGGEVFAWHLEREQDPAGNPITYSYARDGARLYLSAIRWSIWALELQYEDRPDVLRTSRGGFPRTTAWRARAIDLVCTRPDAGVLRTWSLGYTEAANGASLLSRVELAAGAGAERVAQPALSFTYAGFDPAAARVEALGALLPPPALGSPGTQLVDLDGTALPDVLELTGTVARRWRNAGGGTLEGPLPLRGVPSLVSLARGGVALADLDADGRADLFAVDQPTSLAFHADGAGGFDPSPTVLPRRPSLRLDDPRTRLTDLDGDGVTDLLWTGPDAFVGFRYVPGAGWTDGEVHERVHDLARFPDVRFGDRGVRLADVTGDGLADVVLLRSGDCCYWPALGGGAYGPRVELDRPPALPAGFRDEQLHLVDVDGDGCADVVLFDEGGTTIWLNRAGNAFAPPVRLPIGPPPGRVALAADLWGDGRPGFVWDASSRTAGDSGYRLLRLAADSPAPYLMTAIDNGMGGLSRMRYATTTRERLRDAAAGRPWQGQLPVVVHVLVALEQEDAVTGRTMTSAMQYHDGVWDGPNREFRGFRSVAVESGDPDQPMRQELTFFQGDPDAMDLVDRARQRALAGSPVGVRILGREGDAWATRQSSVQTWEARLEHDGGSAVTTVWFPHVVSIETREVDAAGPDRVDRTELAHDAFGNVTDQTRTSVAEGSEPRVWERTRERTTWLHDEDRWLVHLPTAVHAFDGAGVPFSARLTRYDGDAFVGLPDGEATRGLTTAVHEARLLDARTPPDLLAGRDPAALGYVRVEGDAPGWYARTQATRRDAFGNPAEQRDPLGQPTLVTFDADGVFPLRCVAPGGLATSMTFDLRSGEPATLTAANGLTTRSVFDALGRLVASLESVDGDDRLVKAWFVDTAALPVSITSCAPSRPGLTVDALRAADPLALPALGVSVSRTYHDGFGEAIATLTTAPGGRVALTGRRVLDGRGLVVAQLAPAFAPDLSWPGAPSPADVAAASTVRTRYDDAGLVVAVSGPGETRFSVERTPFTIVHREAGDAVTRTERFDARGRLVAVEEEVGDGTTAVHRYDLAPDGRVAALRDADEAVVAAWVYAGPGDPVRISHRDAGTRSYLRDAAGRLVERVDTDGSSLRHTFDAAGRVVGVHAVAAVGGPAVPVREVVYDADPDPARPGDGRFLQGRVAVLREGPPDERSEFRYSYDAAGRPVAEEQTVAGVTETLWRSYDLQGRLTSLTYPDGERVAYDLDAGGAVTGVAGLAEDIAYAADGAPLGHRLPSGVRIETPQDPATHRLLAVRAVRRDPAGDVVLRALAYRYDGVGAITGVEDAAPGSLVHHAFDYDRLHRLTRAVTRADGGGVVSELDYRYDPAGNLHHIADAGAGDLHYDDPAHPGRATSVVRGGLEVPVAYGERGEVTAHGALSGMTLDAHGRLVSATSKVDGQTRHVAYRYDAQNRRVLKQVRDDAGTLLSQTRYAAGLWEASDGQTVRHVYLGSRLIASVTTANGGAPTRRFHLADHLGSVVASLDEAGALVAWQRYAPFGVAVGGEGVLDRYLAREPDAELGLLQFGARWYDPTTGRFLSADWYVLEHPEKAVRLPQGFAVYAYALNNPLSFKDPSGLWFGIDDLIVAAAGFVVGFVSGLVYGLANGQGWGSLLTALETGLTTAAGAWLGWTVAGPVGLVMGGMNGLIGGLHGVYDWSSPEGWFAFLSDSTWSLLGTSLGNVVHIINLFYKDANYREDLSRRQNRNVYEGGFALKKDFAFTQGNVISNAGQGGKGINASFIANHEELHVWQQRFFGPVFQAGYVAWAVGGVIVGAVVWLWHTDTGASGLGSLIETAAYYDNPFEYWAYENDNNWPPSGANPALTY